MTQINPMNQTENLQELQRLQASQTNDIRILLQPWLSFRLYIVFMQKNNPKEKSRRHFYGHEHQCTYNQCVHGMIPNITLRRKKGYEALVEMVEKTYKGKYQSATIYMRSQKGGPFDVLCREYYKGGLQKKNDPLLSDDEGFILYYHSKNGKLEIIEQDPGTIDFAKEINDRL